MVDSCFSELYLEFTKIHSTFPIPLSSSYPLLFPYSITFQPLSTKIQKQTNHLLSKDMINSNKPNFNLSTLIAIFFSHHETHFLNHSRSLKKIQLKSFSRQSFFIFPLFSVRKFNSLTAFLRFIHF